MMDWLAQTWQGFVDWVHDLIVIIFTALKNLVLDIFELLLDGVVFMFNSLQPPEFLANGMSALFNALPSELAYFLNISGFTVGLSIYGAGVSFRLLRKLFTLGQW